MLANGYLKASQVEYRGILREPWYRLHITKSVNKLKYQLL